MSRDDYELILSALINDRVGNWGDGRAEKLKKLIKKVEAELKN